MKSSMVDTVSFTCRRQRSTDGPMADLSAQPLCRWKLCFCGCLSAALAQPCIGIIGHPLSCYEASPGHQCYQSSQRQWAGVFHKPTTELWLSRMNGHAFPRITWSFSFFWCLLISFTIKCFSCLFLLSCHFHLFSCPFMLLSCSCTSPLFLPEDQASMWLCWLIQAVMRQGGQRDLVASFA